MCFMVASTITINSDSLMFNALQTATRFAQVGELTAASHAAIFEWLTFIRRPRAPMLKPRFLRTMANAMPSALAGMLSFILIVPYG